MSDQIDPDALQSMLDLGVDRRAYLTQAPDKGDHVHAPGAHASLQVAHRSAGDVTVVDAWKSFKMNDPTPDAQALLLPNIASGQEHRLNRRHTLPALTSYPNPNPNPNPRPLSIAHHPGMQVPYATPWEHQVLPARGASRASSRARLPTNHGQLAQAGRSFQLQLAQGGPPKFTSLVQAGPSSAGPSAPTSHRVSRFFEPYEMRAPFLVENDNEFMEAFRDMKAALSHSKHAVKELVGRIKALIKKFVANMRRLVKRLGKRDADQPALEPHTILINEEILYWTSDAPSDECIQDLIAYDPAAFECEYCYPYPHDWNDHPKISGPTTRR